MVLETLNSTDQSVLASLSDESWQEIAELAKNLDLSERSVTRSVKKLLSLGLLGFQVSPKLPVSIQWNMMFVNLDNHLLSNAKHGYHSHSSIADGLAHACNSFPELRSYTNTIKIQHVYELQGGDFSLVVIFTSLDAEQVFSFLDDINRIDGIKKTSTVTLLPRHGVKENKR